MSVSESTMIIAVSGASGLIGNQLVAAFESQGHQTRRLVRRPPASDVEIRWDPDDGDVDANALESVDIVVHLAGENIARLEGTIDPWICGFLERKFQESTTDPTGIVSGLPRAAPP